MTLEPLKAPGEKSSINISLKVNQIKEDSQIAFWCVCVCVGSPLGTEAVIFRPLEIVHS